MARTSTYLNFARSTEEAFNFYKSVFGTEFVGGIVASAMFRCRRASRRLSDDDKHLVMNVQLPILGGHLLMGTDAPESMGFQLNQGNNVYICLAPGHPRRGRHAVRRALRRGQGGNGACEEMFWGDYFGSLVDKFGVHWMINCTSKT